MLDKIDVKNKNLPDGTIMTVKDIVDFINKERGVSKGDKGFIRHTVAMKQVEELTEIEGFGTGTKILTLLPKGNEATQKIETYALTRKQAIAVGAKIDNKRLIQLVDYVDELEKINIEQSMEIKKLNLEVKALEQKVEEDYILGRIRIAEKLNELGANLDPIALTNGKFVSMVSEDVGDALTNACSDIRTGVQVYSATHLLNENNIDILTRDFNDAMISAGLMERYFYDNKPYKKMVNNVNYYGYNREASSVKELPYQVRYYEDRFVQLVQLLRNEGYLD